MQTGIFDGMSFEEYSKIPAINKSGLDEFSISPLHYWARYLDPKREPERETPALKLGSAIHCAILEPARFETEYRVAPSPERFPQALNTHEQYKERCKLLGVKVTGNKSELKARIREWHALQSPVTALMNGIGPSTFFDDIEDAFYKGGFRAITEDNLKVVEAIRKRALESKTIKTILGSEYKTERVMVWQDPELGVYCKGRLDATADDDGFSWLIDFKSAEEAGRAAFKKAAAKYQLKRQAAWYVDGWTMITSRECHFVFPVYEKTTPWASAFYYASEKLITLGRSQNRKLLKGYAACLAKNEWPGYPEELQPLDPMPYEDAEAGMEVF